VKFPVTLIDEKLLIKIFKDKEEFHLSQARLPIEEKIKILVALQHIAVEVQQNKNLRVWQI
jgi:hypothetical protein